VSGNSLGYEREEGIKMIDWSSLTSAIIGGIIAGSFTILAVIVSHNKQVATRKDKDEEQITGFLKSIHIEISALWNRYNSISINVINSLVKDQFVKYYWSVTQDYFPIYHANTNLIGKVDNEALTCPT